MDGGHAAHGEGDVEEKGGVGESEKGGDGRGRGGGGFEGDEGGFAEEVVDVDGGVVVVVDDGGESVEPFGVVGRGETAGLWEEEGEDEMGAGGEDHGGGDGDGTGEGDVGWGSEGAVDVVVCEDGVGAVVPEGEGGEDETGGGAETLLETEGEEEGMVGDGCEEDALDAESGFCGTVSTGLGVVTGGERFPEVGVGSERISTSVEDKGWVEKRGDDDTGYENDSDLVSSTVTTRVSERDRGERDSQPKPVEQSGKGHGSGRLASW